MWFPPCYLMNISMFPTPTIINFNILILYTIHQSQHHFCSASNMKNEIPHALILPCMLSIPFAQSSNTISIYQYQLVSISSLYSISSEYKLAFLTQQDFCFMCYYVYLHCADKHNSTNCFRIIFPKNFLPREATKSNFKHSSLKIQQKNKSIEGFVSK